MYANDGDIDIDALMVLARKRIFAQDRALIVPIITTIETFASEHSNIIIGGMLGAHILCADDNYVTTKIDADLWVVEMYSNNIGKVMRECLLYLYDNLAHNSSYTGDRRTLILRAVANDRQYRIFCDYRHIATGYSLGARLGVDIDVNIIQPPSVMVGDVNINIMPRNIQIMYLCGLLCDPLRAADSSWTEYMKLLVKMFAMHDTDVTGSEDNMRTAKIRSTMPDDLDYVIIGESAIHAYMGTNGSNVRPQYLCAFNDIDGWVTKHNYRSHYVDVRLPNEVRMRKMIIHDDKKLVGDIFNALSFMPVSYNEWNEDSKVGAKHRRRHPKHRQRDDRQKRDYDHNHQRDYDHINKDYNDTQIQSAKIGSPFCVLYFIFIDVWALNFIARSARDDDVRDSMNSRIKYLKTIGARFFDWIMTQDSGSTIFPLTYVGTYEPMAVALRSKKKDQPMCALTASELDAMRDQIARTLNE
jgi:hypothetical protein